MKSFFATILLASCAAASPILTPEEQVVQTEITQRQIFGTGITENEYTRYGCRDVIFFFARGTTELGNMGTSSGPPTSDGLKDVFGSENVATEGVDYAALLSTNFLPGGADLLGIAEMKALFNDAATKCPDSKIVAAGYSQGAALTHRAVEDLSDAVMEKIVGVVTYGDTQNLQDLGRIPNFPTEKTLIICNLGDLVCAGTLTILPAHLTYARRVPEAVEFLVERINA